MFQNFRIERHCDILYLGTKNIYLFEVNLETCEMLTVTQFKMKARHKDLDFLGQRYDNYSLVFKTVQIAMFTFVDNVELSYSLF